MNRLLCFLLGHVRGLRAVAGFRIRDIVCLRCDKTL